MSTEQKDQHVEYQQQDWQAAQESDKLFHFHRKQDAKDNAQVVDGHDAVFIRLVDYDLLLRCLWTPKQATCMGGEQQSIS